MGRTFNESTGFSGTKFRWANYEPSHFSLLFKGRANLCSLFRLLLLLAGRKRNPITAADMMLYSYLFIFISIPPPPVPAE